MGLLVALAALGAVLGDNVGYLIGRRLLERPGPFDRRRRDIPRKGEPFFAEHGPKAVFLGRWVAGLRIAAAWLAGISHMRWPTFAFWNALGGVARATSVGLLAYALGDVVEQVFKDVGIDRGRGRRPGSRGLVEPATPTAAHCVTPGVGTGGRTGASGDRTREGSSRNRPHATPEEA